ncbi:Hpt domain-containing protein [Maridesulfovibrio sp.]|uniref:Hpt domain-containing protein n=1 Tax=Maridesulfovibrio sp. TaxID=2795000 RepID=UPI0039EDF40B
MTINKQPDHFDLESAMVRFAQDYELLDEAIAIFKEEAPKHLTAIKRCLRQNKFTEASTHAHTLKSECAAVGAAKAQAISSTMEKTTAAGNFKAALDILPELEQRVAEAVMTLPESTEFMVKPPTRLFQK